MWCFGVSQTQAQGTVQFDAQSGSRTKACTPILLTNMTQGRASLLLVLIALCWGLSWPIGKLLLRDLPPLWIVFLRSAVGALALLVLCIARGRLVIPKRSDLPVVISVSVLHMVTSSALVSIGLKFVTAGRSAVLAYTTPIWVIPGAYLLLGEKVGWLSILSALLGVAGLVALFDPQRFSWSDPHALYGNGLVLLAALFWAMSILYNRAHKWVTPPFELTFWQSLLATILLFPVAIFFEGVPSLTLPARAIGLLLYGGVFGIALGYWALTTVNRAIPSTMTSLGLLLVPVFGIACSWLLLGEKPAFPLIAATALIITSVGLNTLAGGKPATSASESPRDSIDRKM
ncbi:Permease of the drug/metabolite transporter (DMT) superfamily [Paraburkholderia steynii]|uniref:Permease of the drug/metabolite transporter (DMT) superfamily n=2 Tax=Paraburkholderia steynii TaxID=1245441 RepID=A0A7Z7BLP5_9BURK|nr:Permease of the drug/metabolite transporter (DMT) superfamily [Paraburkholderia steynii]